MKIPVHIRCVPALAMLCWLFIPRASTAQQKSEFEKKREEARSKVDLSAVRAGIITNLGLFSGKQIKAYRNKQHSTTGLPVTFTNETEWRVLYENLRDADVRVNKLKAVDEFARFDRSKRADTDVIPIGIINVDVTALDDKQVNDNRQQKEKNQKADVTAYENIHILAVSVLQEDIYQSTVRFRLSPDLHFTNINNPILGVEIDFQDGKGFRQYNFNEQEISYTFQTLGERAICFRVGTKRGTTLCYTKVNIRALSKPEFWKTFEVKQTAKGGRTATTVVGGEASVLLGCDNVFDRPVLILEGFDPNNDQGISSMTSRYLPTFTPLLRNGYDLVFFNYADGRARIQDNALYAQWLIDEINRIKQGNADLIVIGESMGGLVGRYALRTMEQQRGPDAHHVSHFISFDTPHRGANIPIGIQLLGRDAINSPGVNFAIQLFQGPELVNLIQAAGTPAARQLLVNYFGTTPDPAFTAFQNEINAPDFGYPRQCRNLAVLNGSIRGDGQRNTRGERFNPEQVIFEQSGPYLLINYLAQAKTNTISAILPDTRTWVSRLLVNVLGVTTTDFIRPIEATLNYDLAPGGYQTSVADIDHDRGFLFTFIPSYSAVDLPAPITSDGQFYQSVQNRNSPFTRIYGDDNNTEHINVEFESAAWRDLFLTQFGVAVNPVTGQATNDNCNSVSVNNPPLPVFQGQTYSCGADEGQVTLRVDESLNGLYNYVWRVYPGGETIQGPIAALSLRRGVHTVTCTRTVGTGPNTRSSTYTGIVFVCESGVTCRYNEDAFIYTLNDNGQDVFAHRTNNILFATTSNGSFVSRARLLNNGMPYDLANCFAETDPRGGSTTPSLTSGCYVIKSQKTGQSLQAMTDGSIKQQSGNGQNDQIWKAEDIGNSQFRFITQNGSNQVIKLNDGNSYGEQLSLGGYTNDDRQKWFVGQNGTSGNYRIYRSSNLTWDLNNYGNNPELQIWGNTSEPFYDYRSFRFESATCPSGGTPPPNCDFNVSANTVNASCSQQITLNASCNGANCDGVSYAWTGNGLNLGGQSATFSAPGSNGSFNYTVTASRAGCASKTATGTVNVSGCGGGTTGTNCTPLPETCSGNDQEKRTVTINSTTGGNFPLVITYRSHEKTVDGVVQVNGVAQTVRFNQTGVYTTVTTAPVQLNQGSNNTVVFNTQAGGGYLCFNQICVGSGGGSTPPPPPPPTTSSSCQESEAVTNGSGSVVSGGNASGGQYRASFGNSSEGLTYTLTVPSPGTYTLKLSYSSGDNPTGSVIVNGGTPQDLVLPSTSGWSNFVDRSLTVTLGQTVNSIRIQGNRDGSFNQDKLCAVSGSGRLAASEVPEASLSTTLTVTPNPTQGVATARFRLGAGEAATLSVTNLLGKTLHRKAIVGTGDDQSERIELDREVPGLYLIRLSTGKASYISKVLLER